MEKLSQQKQMKESCEPVVRLVNEQELTIPQAARGLSMSDQTKDLDAEVSRLKRELTEVRMECDILKQTVAYFAKAKLPGGGS
jgi:transposase-like protein